MIESQEWSRMKGKKPGMNIRKPEIVENE